MSLKNKHIFIVEDNTLNRVVYQVTLPLYGAYITFDRWGKNTLDNLDRAGDVDLIILDLMLYGGISGFDIFEQIRNIPKFAGIPIVAVSAADSSSAIPRAKELGFDGFVSKPIDERTFPQYVEKFLRGEHIWDDGTLPFL